METKFRFPCPAELRGLAAPLRMAAAYGGLKYESVEYELQAKPGGGWDRSEWMEKKPALVEKNALMNLPYIVDGDIVISTAGVMTINPGPRIKVVLDKV